MSANARRNADGLGVFRRRDDERSRHVTRQQVSARGNLGRQYNMVSWALNSFGVPLDDFLPGAKR